MSTERLERVRHCVTSATCMGPSILTDSGYGWTNGDRWDCQGCGRYAVVRAGYVPREPEGWQKNWMDQINAKLRSEATPKGAASQQEAEAK